MKPIAAVLCLALLPACQDDTAQKPPAIAMTATAVGHFCQMNMLEHPGPKAQVHLEGLPGTPLFFSQVRDAIAYLRMPEQSHEVSAVYVSDMGQAPSWQRPGPENWVSAEGAVYIVGSERVGGMGAPETVPFADVTAAETFMAQNGGQIMALYEIPDHVVLAPVPDTADDQAEDADFTARLRALSNERTH